jgi:hypothetical protein
MTKSIINAIHEAVLKHYSESSEPLLLAELGKILRSNSSWPAADEHRSLSRVIQDMAPEVVLVRDPDAQAYVVVVSANKKGDVEQAIARRQKTRILYRLPRSILLAFCLKSVNGQNVYVRTTAPFRYQIAENPGSKEFVIVEERFRSPGLYVDDPRSLAQAVALRLADGIQDWAKQHDVRLEMLFLSNKVQSYSPALDEKPQPKRGTNALARLYAAQPTGLAERIVMPFDIAVYLSRLP